MCPTRLLPLLLLSAGMAIAHAEPIGQPPAVPSSAVPCLQGLRLKNTHTPPELYLGVVQCARERATFPAAANMFVLAGVYGRYDQLRVKDASAHQAVSVMRMAIDGHLSDDFRAYLRQIGASRPAMQQMCAMVRRVGPPAYFPQYMVEHGLGATRAALEGHPAPGPLNEKLDKEHAWDEAIEGYLHCSE